MRILCDHHIPPKYVRAFEQEPSIAVTTVRDELAADASDAAIESFAATNDWVVFTNDSDFFPTTDDHGLLVYDQTENPPAGEIVTAVRNIASAYASDSEIVETVPDGWI